MSHIRKAIGDAINEGGCLLILIIAYFFFTTVDGIINHWLDIREIEAKIEAGTLQTE